MIKMEFGGSYTYIRRNDFHRKHKGNSVDKKIAASKNGTRNIIYYLIRKDVDLCLTIYKNELKINHRV